MPSVRGFVPALLLSLVASSCTKEGTVDARGTATAEPVSAPGAMERARLDSAVAGATIERLTTEPTDDLFPARSPNEKDALVLFQAETYDKKGDGRRLVSQVIDAIDVQVKSSRRLLSVEGRASSQPSFTRDGKTVVFVTNANGPRAIVKAAPTPGAPVTLIVASDAAPELGEPAVSPMGGQVAFSMKDKSGARVVATIAADGSGLSIAGEGRSPAWSPAGDHLAFVRTVEGYNHVFVASAASPKDAAQVTRGELDCDKPSFSPDGKRLVFASNAGWKQLHRDRGALLHLFVVSVDGGPVSPLTTGSARSATPHWATDGWIYFSSDRDGNFNLFRIEATTP